MRLTNYRRYYPLSGTTSYPNFLANQNFPLCTIKDSLATKSRVTI